MENNKGFEYQLLDRMKDDCNYYLKVGNRQAKHLWGHNEVDHIAKMKELWNQFKDDEKPEWLTFKQISDFEKEMTNQS